MALECGSCHVATFLHDSFTFHIYDISHDPKRKNLLSLLRYELDKNQIHFENCPAIKKKEHNNVTTITIIQSDSVPFCRYQQNYRVQLCLSLSTLTRFLERGFTAAAGSYSYSFMRNKSELMLFFVPFQFRQFVPDNHCIALRSNRVIFWVRVLTRVRR